MASSSTDELRVPFGPLDNQSVPVSWAEGMLRDLFDAYPTVFGKVLMRATLGDRAPIRRKKGSADDDDQVPLED